MSMYYFDGKYCDDFLLSFLSLEIRLYIDLDLI